MLKIQDRIPVVRAFVRARTTFHVQQIASNRNGRIPSRIVEDTKFSNQTRKLFSKRFALDWSTSRGREIAFLRLMKAANACYNIGTVTIAEPIRTSEVPDDEFQVVALHYPLRHKETGRPMGQLINVVRLVTPKALTNARCTSLELLTRAQGTELLGMTIDHQPDLSLWGRVGTTWRIRIGNDYFGLNASTIMKPTQDSFHPKPTAELRGLELPTPRLRLVE